MRSRAKIRIKKSPTADTRTCDWSKVTRQQLRRASTEHIIDVRLGIQLFVELLQRAANSHDDDTLNDLDSFYADFQTGFEQTGWWDRHRKLCRHHLNIEDGVPGDVDLVDVIEHVVDCVMAGMARSGSVYELKLSDALLQRAFQNTVKLLQANVEVIDDPASGQQD